MVYLKSDLRRPAAAAENTCTVRGEHDRLGDLVLRDNVADVLGWPKLRPGIFSGGSGVLYPRLLALFDPPLLPLAVLSVSHGVPASVPPGEAQGDPGNGRDVRAVQGDSLDEHEGARPVWVRARLLRGLRDQADV